MSLTGQIYAPNYNAESGTAANIDTTSWTTGTTMPLTSNLRAISAAQLPGQQVDRVYGIDGSDRLVEVAFDGGSGKVLGGSFDGDQPTVATAHLSPNGDLVVVSIET